MQIFRRKGIQFIISACLFLMISIGTKAQYTFQKLVWSDEFNAKKKEVDATKWAFDKGNGCPALCGWGGSGHQHRGRYFRQHVGCLDRRRT